MFLKQSTALTVKMGPFVDSADGNTQKTALTLAQADIRVSKNGGAFAQTNNAAGATHDANGWYGVPLDATDTNTVGKVEVFVHKTGALAVWRTFFVLPANVYDSLVGTDLLQVDNTQWLGATPAALTTNGYLRTALLRWLTDDAGGTPSALQSGRVDSYVGAASAGVETDFANALLDDARAGHTTAGTVGEAINKVMTGITGAKLASDGLDLISITDVTSDADARSTFPKMIRALFNRFYNEVTNTSTQQKVKNDAGSVISTMANSDVAGTQTKGKSA